MAHQNPVVARPENIMLESLIKCPKCAAKEFIEIALPDKEGFRKAGAIVCRNCDQLYIIHERILSLMPAEIADVDREIAFIKTYEAELPKSAAAKKIHTLREQANSKDTEWILYEKNFWDQKKYQHRVKKLAGYNWNRAEVRRKHIIDFIKKNVPGRIVLELGSGNAATLYNILNPQRHDYTLVCTDIAFHALLAAGNHHPGAILIQCNAVDPPFRNDSIDMIFEFGTLHHLPEKDRILSTHIKLLKNGGYLGIHDPINRRKSFLSSILWLQRFTNEQSEHNDWIDERRTFDYLGKTGKIIHAHFEYSPVRSWLVLILVNKLGFNNKWTYLFMTNLDQIVIKTIGRLWKRMDGKSMALVWQKAG